jgi:hypothetical protein
LFLAGTTKPGVTQMLYILLNALAVDSPPVLLIDCDRPFRFSSTPKRKQIDSPDTEIFRAVFSLLGRGINRQEVQSLPLERPDFNALDSCCGQREMAMKEKGSEVSLADRRSIFLTTCAATVVYRNERKPQMSKILIVFALLCAGLSVLAGGSYGASSDEHQDVHDSSAQPVNAVVQWNRTLLVIVRTPKAQPATIHPTRSFAIMHAAIYDAVNAIDRTHTPYLVRLTGVSRFASQEAAVDTAAHAVLVTLYPNFQTTLDAQLQQLLAQISEGADRRKASGSVKLSRTAFWLSEVTTDRLMRRFLSSLELRRGITSQRHRTFPSSLNSRTGPMSCPSPCSARVSFAPALLPR